MEDGQELPANRDVVRVWHAREVRATYHTTGINRFETRGPGDVAAFVRSVLTDNSRKHLVALYLDGSHRVTS